AAGAPSSACDLAPGGTCLGGCPTVTLLIPDRSVREAGGVFLPVRFCGRLFSKQELELIREIARDYAGLGVTEIARTVCELLDWKRPSGGLKNHECRLLLEHLRNAEMLTLPAVRALGGRGPRKVKVTTGEAPGELIAGPAAGFSSMQVQLVKGGDESQRWRQYVEQHHYLGCPVPYGAHLRYWVRHEGRVLGCLLW